MKKQFTGFLILLLLSFLGLPHSLKADDVPMPVITSISPVVLNNYNDLITINGENLIYTEDDELLRFAN